MPKIDFASVGERIRYIGASRYRYETWPEDAWLKKGITGTVTEFHKESPEVRVGGELFEAIPPYAVVTWDFGGETAIDAEYEGKTWERIGLPRGGNPEDNDKRLLKVAIEREPLRVAKQLGYEIHRLSPKDIVDKDDYARGYRYRLSKTDPTQPYPQIVMARSESEVATFLKGQIEGNPVERRLEPWQMTKKEFIAQHPEFPHPEVQHRGQVFQALRLGKEVPPEVMADYPDMPRPPEAVPEVKEYWQKTQREIVSEHRKLYKKTPTLGEQSAMFRTHYEMVKRALEEGKEVPAKVLRDYPLEHYPDLAKLVAKLPAAKPKLKHRGVEPKGIAIGDELGVEYDGIQPEIGMQFTDVAETGTTFYANTLEEAKTQLAEKRRLFAPPPSVKTSNPQAPKQTSDAIPNLLPMSPGQGPPLPRGLGIRWPWREENGRA